MPENKSLTDKQRMKLSAGGGYTSIQDIMDAAQSSLQSSTAGSMDPYGGGKITQYPSRSLGFPQYYNKTAYKRLGFNPFEDNFEKYKTQSTNWELFQDAQKAFTKMHNNMYSFFGIGGQDSNTRAATNTYEQLIEQGAPIGRDDTYSWALKQYVQAGYTAAIVSSIASEELALAGATALSKGATAEAAWARTAENFNRIFHIGDKLGDLNTAKKMYDLGDMSRKTATTMDHVKDMQDISKARAFWNQSKNLGQKAFNNMFAPTAGYIQAVKRGDYALNGFANATHAASTFWREMKNFNLAFDEAGMEQGSVEKDVMKQLMTAYEQKHGEAPQGEELKRIQETAKSAGNSTYLTNVGLIYLTNHIGFDLLFSKFRPRIFSESIRNSAYGKMFINPGNLKKGVRPSAEFVKSGFLNQAKYYLKPSTLKKAPIRTLKYLGKATLTGFNEGTQEYLQEVIQDAESRRAADKYMKGIDGGYLQYYGQSMQKYVSPEGADIFLSGFAMGAFAGPHNFMVSKSADALHAGAEYLTGNYKKNRQHQKEMQARYEREVNNINEMFNKPWSKDIGLGGLMTYRKQNQTNAEFDDAVKQEDEKRFRDIKDNATLDTIYNAINKGTFDNLIDYIGQLDNLSDEETLAAYKDVLGEDASAEDILAFKADAKTVIDRAKYIKNLKEDVDKRFINPFTFAESKEDDDTTFGYNSHFMWKAFEGAKREIVKNQYSYQRTLERQEAIMKDMAGNPPFWNKKNVGPASDYTVLFNTFELNQETDLLERELETLKSIPASKRTPRDARDLREKTDKLEHLQSMKNMIGELRKTYYEEALANKIAENDKTIRVGSAVNITSKGGGSAEVIDERGDKFKVKKSSGWVGWVSKNSLTLDESKKKKDTTQSGKVTEELWKTYKDYMKFLAKKNDNSFDESKARTAFNKLLDFYALNQDSKNLTEVLNMLMNPKGFEEILKRKAAVEQHVWENKKQIIADALEASINAKENNFFIQELADKHKAFFLEEDLERLFNDAKEYKEQLEYMDEYAARRYFDSVIMPENVYDITSMKPIDKMSKRYQDIKAEVQEFLDNKWDREAKNVEEFAKDETTAADEAPVEPTVEPTTTAKPKTAITLETPFSEWPADLQEQAITLWRKANASYQESVAEGRKEFARLITDTIEDFVASQPNAFKLTPILKAYNQDLGIKEEVASKIEKPVKQPEVVTPTASETEEEDDQQTMAKEAPAEGVGDVEDAAMYPEAKVDIPKEILDRIITGEVTAMTLAIAPKTTESIVKALRKEGVLRPNEQLSNEHISATTKMTVGDVEIVMTYLGRQEVHQTKDGLYGMMNKLGISTTQTETYKYPFEMDEKTYYASSEAQQYWLQGNGKQQVFGVAVRPISVPMEEAAKQGLFVTDNWSDTIEERLSNAISYENLDVIFDNIVEENTTRDLKGDSFLPSEVLQVYYDRAKEAISGKLNIFDITPGQSYEMKGKLLNFGVAIVRKVTPEGVVFESYKDNTLSEPVKEAELKNVIKMKITDMNETIAEQSLEISPEEKEILKENLKSADEFEKDTDAIIELLDQADTMTDEEVDKDFENNLGC